MTRLGSPENLEEFARLLYATFRAADHLGLTNLVVITPKGSGLALAINDRLEKASRGR
jgi:L-threonylcarbamoyladenylate synthase